jgi:hypothetical protein
MRVLSSHFLADLVLFGVMTVAAFWGLAYGWWHSRLILAQNALPLWRRVLASIGLLVVSGQALLFVLSWTRIGRDPMIFGRWANFVDPTFLVAVPCILAGKGAYRWWLLSSSVLLFVMCFLTTLTA